MGKKSKSAEKTKRQSGEENRRVQESTREDDFVFAEDLPKRRRRQQSGEQSLPQHAFRPGPSFNSGSFQTPAAQYAADDIRPRMMQESGRDYSHDRTSRQDERDDPRFSGGMKVNPLYSGDGLCFSIYVDKIILFMPPESEIRGHIVFSLSVSLSVAKLYPWS